MIFLFPLDQSPPNNTSSPKTNVSIYMIYCGSDCCIFSQRKFLNFLSTTLLLLAPEDFWWLLLNMISLSSVLLYGVLRGTCITIPLVVLLELFLAWSSLVLLGIISQFGDCMSVNLCILLSLLPISLLSKTNLFFVTEKVFWVIIIRHKSCSCSARLKI